MEKKSAQLDDEDIVILFYCSITLSLKFFCINSLFPASNSFYFSRFLSNQIILFCLFASFFLSFCCFIMSSYGNYFLISLSLSLHLYSRADWLSDWLSIFGETTNLGESNSDFKNLMSTVHENLWHIHAVILRSLNRRLSQHGSHQTLVALRHRKTCISALF